MKNTKLLFLLCSVFIVACEKQKNESPIANLDIEKITTLSRAAIIRELPEYSASDLVLVELSSRFRPGLNDRPIVEAVFINMDTLGNAIPDNKIWKQENSDRTKPNVTYEQIRVLFSILENPDPNAGTVSIKNLSYPGTIEELRESYKDF